VEQLQMEPPDERAGVDAVAPVVSADVHAKTPAAEPVVELSITGPGLSFRRPIGQDMVLRIMRLVLTGDGDDVGRTSNGLADVGRRVEQVAGDGRRQSLAEMYRRAGPKKYPEKLATIGTFITNVLDRQSFTVDELRTHFRAVNEPAPANMPRDLRAAMGEGWIAEEHGQPGQYT
jgi:hypothetical protein